LNRRPTATASSRSAGNLASAPVWCSAFSSKSRGHRDRMQRTRCTPAPTDCAFHHRPEGNPKIRMVGFLAPALATAAGQPRLENAPGTGSARNEAATFGYPRQAQC
jgi:hypothetical protein